MPIYEIEYEGDVFEQEADSEIEAVELLAEEIDDEHDFIEDSVEMKCNGKTFIVFAAVSVFYHARLKQG